MTDLFTPLFFTLPLLGLVWLWSLTLKNASLVDLFWSLLFMIVAVTWFDLAKTTFAQWLLLILIFTWGLRLHFHLLHRNWGSPEDRRYQAMRSRNNPGFWWKSFFLVFLLQGVIAWVACWSLYGALQNPLTLNGLSACGFLIALLALFIESIADWQLTVFTANRENRGKVLNAGLWRYSRHPNYFGECCFWWGIYLVALSAGAWWTIISPLLMTTLLLKVSGVSLLENDIQERRPEYAEYIRTTSAFFPWPPKSAN